MSEIITCPSGLAGRVRGMRVREERALADRRLAKSGGQLDAILSACWEETIDPGPYVFGEAIDWSQVLQGDRFFALLEVRSRSYGSNYAFTVSCENRGCRARVDWELDLHDLPVRLLSDESRAAFLAGNRFHATLPDAGRKVTFRLVTGADERRLATLRRAAGERPFTTILNFRLDAIEGVEPRDKGRWIDDLGMADVSFLLSEFSRVDCGVETELEVECADCYGVTRVELPFDKTFFFPEVKPKVSSPT